MLISKRLQKKLQQNQWKHEEELRQKSIQQDKAIEAIIHFIDPFRKDLHSKIFLIDVILQNGHFRSWMEFSQLQPDYDFAYKSILGENIEWIREKIYQYNALAENIIDNIVPMLEEAIKESLKQIFPENLELINQHMVFFLHCIMNKDFGHSSNLEGKYKFADEHRDEFLEIRNSGEPLSRINEIKTHLEKAKGVAEELEDKLGELREQIMDENDIEEGQIKMRNKRKEKEKSLRGLI